MDKLNAERTRDRVIIAAAVAALFGRRAAIRQVRAVADGESEWMREGRLAIQTSHRMTAPLIRLAAERKGGKA